MIIRIKKFYYAAYNEILGNYTYTTKKKLF